MQMDNKVAVFQMENAAYNDHSIKKSFVFLLSSLGLDKENIGKEYWNPFSDFIKPGNSVVLKPNWVRESHSDKENEWEYVITHPGIIKETLHYVLTALQGEGKVIIADAPLTSASFKKIMNRMNTDELIRMGRESGVDVKILDIRNDEWITKNKIVVRRKKLRGDPKGDVVSDLKEKSEFSGHSVSKLGYFGADYDKEETNKVHTGCTHKYKVSRTIIDADVFINLPKLKTHAKAGITCSLKNLVGINTYKNWLPHHNEGSPEEGGDQCPPGSSVISKIESKYSGKIKQIMYNVPFFASVFVYLKDMVKYFLGDSKTVVRDGSWYGNDTLWRMTLDLNKILFYANGTGEFRPPLFESAKKYFSIVDGIIAGEGNGPMRPNLKKTGLIVAGYNPVSVDCTCAKLMGFDYKKIPILHNAFNTKYYKLCDFKYNDITVLSNCVKFNLQLRDILKDNIIPFEPHFGWKGHIEVDKN